MRKKPFKKIGLNEDGVSNSPFAGSLNNGILLSSPSEEVIDLIQGNVDRLYNDFIEIVANGRGYIYQGGGSNCERKEYGLVKMHLRLD
jgi:ClpP class serine protease